MTHSSKDRLWLVKITGGTGGAGKNVQGAAAAGAACGQGPRQARAPGMQQMAAYEAVRTALTAKIRSFLNMSVDHRYIPF
jgi:hypothetical protein